MLLTLFEICLGIIFVVTCFVDHVWPHILFWSVIVLTVVDALIRTRILSKRTFQCKDCGHHFSLKGRRLFNKLGPWKMPNRIKHGNEIEPRVYGRSHIECPACDSYKCVLLMDE